MFVHEYAAFMSIRREPSPASRHQPACCPTQLIRRVGPEFPHFLRLSLCPAVDNTPPSVAPYIPPTPDRALCKRKYTRLEGYVCVCIRCVYVDTTGALARVSPSTRVLSHTVDSPSWSRIPTFSPSLPVPSSRQHPTVCRTLHTPNTCIVHSANVNIPG